MRYPPGAKPVEDESAEASGDSAQEQTPSTPTAPDSAELLAEILTSVYRAEGGVAFGFAALRQRLEVIEQALGISSEADAATTASAPTESAEVTESAAAPEGDEPQPQTLSEAPPAGQVVAEVVAEPTEQEDRSEVEATAQSPPAAAPVAQPVAVAEQLPPTAQPVDPAPHQMPEPVQPVRDVRRVAAQPTGGELAAIVFGGDLAYHESLSGERQALLVAVRQGQEDALGLIGQLLIVRAATMDQLPTLLKDVGEAWFRWRPDQHGAPDAMRDALIVWLHSRLEAVGLGNRIDLVRAGDRYDSKRHNAKARGVEVTSVHGWVVLRDNGNVYTKAAVTVA